MKMRLIIGLLGLFITLNLAAQTPAQKEAVWVSANASTSPVAITLNWVAFSGSTGYTIYRKTKTATTWTSLGTAAAAATQYVDNGVTSGTYYEYKVVRTTSSAGTGYGYIAAGIQVPVVDARGKMVLLVDNTFTTALSTQITQLTQDLRADGWVVLRHDVSRSATTSSIRAIVQADYNADPTNVKAVFIFGHVPVPYSGNLAPDGHGDHVGAWPADGYYGEMNGTWTDNSVNATGGQSLRNHNVPGDGKWDQSDYPSTVELQVGRVDMANLGSFQYYASLNEQALLTNYLTKLHEFKSKQFTPTFRGAVFDNFVGISNPIAACGYRSVSANVGPANTSDLNGSGAAFSTYVNNQSYLWTYSCGGGQWMTAANVTSIYELAQNVAWGGVFNMMCGSYFGDWDCDDNLVRATLASGKALANCYSSVPNWWFHNMGMGDNIGYSTWMSMNNGSVYAPQNCGWNGSTYSRVHMGLMGDPSLRQVMVNMPSNLQVTNSGGLANFTWTAASGSPAGYYIYDLGASGTSIPVRVTPNLVTGTSYSNASVPFVSGRQYMVRAVKLETAQTGTYYNMSLGVIATASGQAAPDCLGVAGGSTTVGSSCSDNNVCTANDVYNASCVCTGTNITPTATLTAGGTTSICSGGSVLLSASTGTGYTYVWKRSGTTISGASSSSYSASVAGSYTVIVSNGGCSTTSSAVTVTVSTGTVTATLTAGGSTALCSGGSVVLNANTGTGLSYVWKRSGTTISGATSSSYTANQTGSYTVTVTGGSCSATSSAVNVSSAATATLTAGGSTSFCSGGSVALNASTGTGYTYTWKRSGTTISGATSSSYTATQAGSYTVTVSNGTCSATSAAVTVTVTSGSVIALVTAYGPTAICPGGGVLLAANTGTGLSYVWRKGGTAISGATWSWYTATTVGAYTVSVTSGSCSGTSPTLNVTSCSAGMLQPDEVEQEGVREGSELENGSASDGAEGISAMSSVDEHLRIYPNPASTVINMVINDPEAAVVEVIDLLGEKLIRAPYTSLLDVSVLSSGTYVVLIRGFDGKLLARGRLIRE